ncbi:hypothetical protein CTRI78_v000515 [Colletotrichum trifolii]|uniref:Uncharacterized protein n=1 Tax=Colletotrichum trifolii TaxID=5466 RepID=A0A4V3HXH1_COLTR|nr:hypothetical protein CTRI78_v000515 [Colletotrichum trifolii]
MPSANATVWDDKAHADLLLALLPVLKLSKDQWDEVLSTTRAKGYNYTSGAVIQHLQKLQKKEATVDNGEGGSGSAVSTPKKTPAKKAATPRKRKTPAKSVKAEDGDEEEEADEVSPTKKPKPVPRPNLKTEEDEKPVFQDPIEESI